jgi:cation diffusion facilitator CzcD-associated flavoprotein CzcO
LTLRKVEELPYSNGDVRVEWWNEDFDAVVVGSWGESDSPYVPSIPGLAEWARAFPESIYHAQEYRTPEDFSGKVRNPCFRIG